MSGAAGFSNVFVFCVLDMLDFATPMRFACLDMVEFSGLLCCVHLEKLSIPAFLCFGVVMGHAERFFFATAVSRPRIYMNFPSKSISNLWIPFCCGADFTSSTAYQMRAKDFQGLLCNIHLRPWICIDSSSEPFALQISSRILGLCTFRLANSI